MKFEIVKNGEKTEIEMKGLKGRDIDALFEEMVKVESAENVAQASLSWMNTLKEKTSKLSGLSIEELDDLDSDDRSKLMGYIVEKVKKNLNFIQS